MNENDTERKKQYSPPVTELDSCSLNVFRSQLPKHVWGDLNYPHPYFRTPQIF